MPKLPGINHLRAIRAFEKAELRLFDKGSTLPWLMVNASLLFLELIQ